MMPQAAGPPDTTAYYRVAYVWVAVVYAAYSTVLWWRARRVRGQLRALRDGEAGTSRGT
jgi:hypothetical protein